jgi:hypothetical protein
MVKVIEFTEEETTLLKSKASVSDNLIGLLYILSEQIKNNKEEFWNLIHSEHPEIPNNMTGMVDKSTEPWRVIFQKLKEGGEDEI